MAKWKTERTPAWERAIRDADKQMTLQFGQVSVQIKGSSPINQDWIPKQWQYQAEEENRLPDVFIEMEDRPLPQGNPAESGWSCLETGEKREATYHNNRGAVFSLLYGLADPSITVIARKDDACSARLGVQHALLLALYRKCIGLHGVTLVCGKEIVILSAPSGTGKTTLGKLLEKYCDAVVINGDFALLCPTESGVIFEPTPFCGTSGRALNHRFRVNRVVFLSQAKDNVWREPDGRESVTQFMSNCFVPAWDKDLREAVRENILKCIGMVKVNEYAFAPTQEAAETFLTRIEEKVLHFDQK